MIVRKIGRGKYEVEENGEIAKVEYHQNGLYSTFDGKYHPGWNVYCKDMIYDCIGKEEAMGVAMRVLGIKAEAEV